MDSNRKSDRWRLLVRWARTRFTGDRRRKAGTARRNRAPSQQGIPDGLLSQDDPQIEAGTSLGQTRIVGLAVVLLDPETHVAVEGVIRSDPCHQGQAVLGVGSGTFPGRQMLVARQDMGEALPMSVPDPAAPRPGHDPSLAEVHGAGFGSGLAVQGSLQRPGRGEAVPGAQGEPLVGEGQLGGGSPAVGDRNRDGGTAVGGLQAA